MTSHQMGALKNKQLLFENVENLLKLIVGKFCKKFLRNNNWHLVETEPLGKQNPVFADP